MHEPWSRWRKSRRWRDVRARQWFGTRRVWLARSGAKGEERLIPPGRLRHRFQPPSRRSRAAATTDRTVAFVSWPLESWVEPVEPCFGDAAVSEVVDLARIVADSTSSLADCVGSSERSRARRTCLHSPNETGSLAVSCSCLASFASLASGGVCGAGFRLGNCGGSIGCEKWAFGSSRSSTWWARVMNSELSCAPFADWDVKGGKPLRAPAMRALLGHRPFSSEERRSRQ